MFRTEWRNRHSLVIEDFKVLEDRATCRALLRELSLEIRRSPLDEGKIAPISVADRFLLAENFEAFIFAEGDQHRIHLRWLAVESAVGQICWCYKNWADLGRTIVAEGVFLRTGSAHEASGMLHLPENAFENVDDMLLILGACGNPAAGDGEEDLRQGSGSLDAGGLKGGVGVVPGVSRDNSGINHGESSVGGVEASTVGEGGRVGNDPAAEGDASSGLGRHT